MANALELLQPCAKSSIYELMPWWANQPMYRLLWILIFYLSHYYRRYLRSHGQSIRTPLSRIFPGTTCLAATTRYCLHLRYPVTVPIKLSTACEDPTQWYPESEIMNDVVSFLGTTQGCYVTSAGKKQWPGHLGINPKTFHRNSLRVVTRYRAVCLIRCYLTQCACAVWNQVTGCRVASGVPRHNSQVLAPSSAVTRGSFDRCVRKAWGDCPSYRTHKENATMCIWCNDS